MTGREGFAAHAPGTFQRRVHDHDFGRRLALTDFPGQTSSAKRPASLDTSLQSALCVKGRRGFPTSRSARHVGAAISGRAAPPGPPRLARDHASEKARSLSRGRRPQGKSRQIADPDVWILRSCMFDANRSRRHVLAGLRNQIRSVARPRHHRHHQPRLLHDHVIRATAEGETPIESLVDDVTAKLTSCRSASTCSTTREVRRLDRRSRDAMPQFSVAGADSLDREGLDDPLPDTTVCRCVRRDRAHLRATRERRPPRDAKTSGTRRHVCRDRARRPDGAGLSGLRRGDPTLYAMGSEGSSPGASAARRQAACNAWIATGVDALTVEERRSISRSSGRQSRTSPSRPTCDLDRPSASITWLARGVAPRSRAPRPRPGLHVTEDDGGSPRLPRRHQAPDGAARARSEGRVLAAHSSRLQLLAPILGVGYLVRNG